MHTQELRTSLNTAISRCMERLSSQDFYTRFVFDKGNDIIHSGDFSQVFLGRDKQKNRKVAIKIVPSGQGYSHYPAIKKWAKIGKKEHSSLINYLGFYEVDAPQDETTGVGFDAIIMDPIRDGSLNTTASQEYDQDAIDQITEGILSGLEVLHGQRMPHGNLKPGNVLIQNIGHLHIRLSDYGFSHQISFDQLSRDISTDTLKYLAPEQIEPQTFGKKGRVGINVDFWALGVMLYELLLKRYPFPVNLDSKPDLLTAILNSSIPSDIAQIKGGLGQLVRACLERDASLRPQNIDELRQLLCGKLVWSPKGLKEPATPPKIASKPVKCRNCSSTNSPGSLICSECHKALFGPSFLMGFRYPNRLGTLAVIFFSLAFLPLGIFYYYFHESLIWNKGEADLHAFLDEASEIIRRGPELANEELVQILAPIGVMIFFSLLSLIFFMVWYNRTSNNLISLGSWKRRFSFPTLLALILCATGSGIAAGFGEAIGILLTIAFLIVPLFAMQELWKGSNPKILQEGISWKKSTPSGMVFVWWLFSTLLPVFILLPFLPNTFDGKIYEFWFFLTVAITGLYWLLGVVFIFRINIRQSKKYKAWAKTWAARQR